jgi:hypothetical protein
MLITVEGIPHPLVSLSLACYARADGRRINGVYSFDTETRLALKLSGEVVAVGDFFWEVVSERDAERLRLELDPSQHSRVVIRSTGICFTHSF